jgi:hypothetical protein
MQAPGSPIASLSLRNTTAFLRYNFNDLISEESGDEFFQKPHDHGRACRRSFPLARAHAVIVGASAQWGFADPKEAERDEYGVYLGYSVDFTRALQAQVFYRSAYYRYSAKPRREISTKRLRESPLQAHRLGQPECHGLLRLQPLQPGCLRLRCRETPVAA